MRSSCRLVLLVSKAGGGLLQGLGCDKLAATPEPLPVKELLTAEITRKKSSVNKSINNPML